MYLHALTALYDRLAADPESGVAPPGYSRQQIAFIVVLNSDGSLLEVQDARIEDGKGKLRNRSVVVCGNAKPSGSGINPCFLWDNAAYALGYKPDDPKPERTRESFEAFRKRHLSLEKAIDDPEYAAVCRFLQSWDPAQAEGQTTLKELATGFGVFQLRGATHYVHQSAGVRRWWEAQLATDGATDAVTGQCLVTGEVGPIARLHEPKIKGVYGGQSAGAAMVSFNFAAGESYGKEQGGNAPLSESAAFKYCTALNWLLDPARGRRMSIGDTSVAYWAAEPAPAEGLFAELFNPSQSAEDESTRSQIGDVLDQIAKGKYPSEQLGPPDVPFYVLGLSPNAARISVRFWHESTLGEMVENLGQHFADLEIGGLGWRPALYQITRELVRDTKDLPPSLAGDLLKSAIFGHQYPVTILGALIRRLRVEGEVSPIRAAVLKAYLRRNAKVEMDTYLNREHPEPAYHCGRLFAVIAFAQAKALGSVNASVVRRTMGSVMASPGLMLGRLQKNAEVGHIPKLESLEEFVHDELRSINVALRDEIPNSLNAAKQAIFALGFYQQSQNLEFVGAQVKAKKRCRTSQGEWMRSKLEVKVAECLTKVGVKYIYEPSAILPNDRERWPDFVVRGANPSGDWYIEVMGYPGDEYEKRRQTKVAAYELLGVTPSGGPAGRLVELDFRVRDYDDRAVLDTLRDCGFPFELEAVNA